MATRRRSATPAPAAPTPARLPNGELRRQVAAFLAAHPAEDFTPTQVARGLSGRSAGAVLNALVTLTGAGHARQTSAKPVRFQATPTTPGAAGTPATPTPAPPPARATAPKRGPRSARTTTAVPAKRKRRTRATAATGTAEPVTGPIVGPHGRTYHPRMLSGLPDVTALQRLRAAGVPVLLYGPPGTGKTSVAEAAFGEDLITVPGDGDTTVADFVGEYTQTPEGRYVFVEGPLIRAMREGRALFIDDATLIPPTVLAVVYPAMDGRREVVVKANGGQVVTAAPGFYILAGHNPGVHGAVLTDALSSRFSVQVQVSTDYDLATQLGINPQAVRVARNLATKQGKGEVGWAPQLRELLAFERIADVLGPHAAAGNLIGVAPEEDRTTVAAVVASVFGTTLTPLALGDRVGKPTPTPSTS